MMGRLDPKLASMPLHLFFLLDTSGSMGVDGKIEALNRSIREAIPALRDVVEHRPDVELLIRVVTFDHDARWHIGTPVNVEQLEWEDVAATTGGTTEIGRAIHLVVEEIRLLAAARHGLPPALVLISDGKPTNLKQPSFGGALRELLSKPWGQSSSRIAIGIGRDADMEMLARFIGHDEIKPLRASNANELTRCVRLASTVLVSELSRAGTGTADALSTKEAPAAAATKAPPPPPSLTDLPPPCGEPVDLPPPPSPAVTDDLTW